MINQELIPDTELAGFYIFMTFLFGFILLCIIAIRKSYRDRDPFYIFMLIILSILVIGNFAVCYVSSNEIVFDKKIEPVETDVLISYDKIIIDIKDEYTFYIENHLDYIRVEQNKFYVEKYLVYNIFGNEIDKKYILKTFDEEKTKL